MTSTQDNRIRKTAGLIDGNGFYQSRATSGGDWVFAASPALTDEGQPSDAATPRPPYHLSDSAVVRAQTRFILDQYTEAYRKLDSTFENVTQLEQYITLKAHADGYLETSRGPGFLERRRPGSCLLQTGTFFPHGDVITALPIAYTNASGFTKDITTSGLMYVQPNTDRGETYEDEGPFSEVVMAGPYVFCTLWASDYETGVHPDVKVEEWVWWGNEMRSEATWAVGALDRKLEAGGTTSDQVVHCTAFLNDLGDLYELDQVWKRKFPENPPARTLLPVRGQGSPRREGAVTHADGAMKMEIQIRALRPGYGAEREVVSTGAETVGYQAEAVRAGELLWISGTFAGDPGGLRSGPGTPAQVDYILERFGEICGAAGTDLQNLLRLRAYVTDASDGYHVHSGVRNAIRREPPCVAVSEVRGPLQLPGATVMMDAIAWIP